MLRRLQPSDLDVFLAYRNDPDVARYQSWEGIDRGEAEAFLAEQAAIDPMITGQWVQLAIEPRASGSGDGPPATREDPESRGRRPIAGDCAFLVREEKPQEAVVGITLARTSQGQGLAADALGRLFDFLFHDRGLHRVVADTDPENIRSWRLLERIGMRREAHHRQNLWFKGRWADELVYALLEHEWR